MVTSWPTVRASFGFRCLCEICDTWTSPSIPGNTSTMHQVSQTFNCSSTTSPLANFYQRHPMVQVLLLYESDTRPSSSLRSHFQFRFLHQQLHNWLGDTLRSCTPVKWTNPSPPRSMMHQLVIRATLPVTHHQQPIYRILSARAAAVVAFNNFTTWRMKRFFRINFFDEHHSFFDLQNA